MAELAIRMPKLFLKIAGCFRSRNGARDFADLRSIVATARKQDLNILGALQLTPERLRAALTPS